MDNNAPVLAIGAHAKVVQATFDIIEKELEDLRRRYPSNASEQAAYQKVAAMLVRVRRELQDFLH